MWPVGPLQTGPETPVLGTPGLKEKGGYPGDPPKVLGMVSPCWPKGHGSLLPMNQKMVSFGRMDLKLVSPETPTLWSLGWGSALDPS